MKRYFERVFDHRGWANRQTLASIFDCPAAHGDATPIIAHLLGAEHVWLSRLQGNAPALPVWPPLNLDQCRTLAADCDGGWTTYLRGLADEAFHADVEYQNSRGEVFCNSVSDVLTQVFTHGQYHRGQIARIVGRVGGKPAITDFIAYVRSGNSPAA